MRELRERTCCDGLCARGYPCPAFAPGVIQGPYHRRRASWLRRVLASFFRTFWSCE